MDLNDGLAQGTEGSKTFVALHTGHVLVPVLAKWHTETRLQEQVALSSRSRRPGEVGGKGRMGEISKSGIWGEFPEAGPA